MGFLSHVSTVVSSRRANASPGFEQDSVTGWAYPSSWAVALAESGIVVTPELSMTLSAYSAGVRMKSGDLSTLPPKAYRVLDDGGKEPVRFSANGLGAGGIGDLAYKLRWQPNLYQTSAECFSGLFASYIMRNVCYAEIIDGPSGFLEQLLPRHPDRVVTERLPSGRLRFTVVECSGPNRVLTQDEMFTVRDLSFDGVHPVSQVRYAANAIGTTLAAERAAGKFFKSGMTAAMLATYPGDKEDEDEAKLHASISRFAAGVENSFGLALVPDDVKITNLAIEPEKAQMMLAREWGVKEIARLLNIPGSKLGVPGTNSYASAIQVAVDYVIGSLRPIAVAFEQAIQRDLILAKGVYVVEFLLDALMRGDPDARAVYYEKAIRNRWMRPSEVRLRENLNPDPDLDRLSEKDFRPGTSGSTSDAGRTDKSASGPGGRVLLHAFLAVHDNAMQCLRRERAAVEKLAKRHADDPAAWKAGLREFYGEHANFVARVMRLPRTVARGFAAEHGSVFESAGIVALETETAAAAWEREEADALASLAIDFDKAA